MVIRQGEYRAEIVRVPGKQRSYVYRVYRGDGTEKLAQGREDDPNVAAIKAEAAISDFLRQELECEQGLLRQAS